MNADSGPAEPPFQVPVPLPHHVLRAIDVRVASRVSDLYINYEANGARESQQRDEAWATQLDEARAYLAGELEELQERMIVTCAAIRKEGQETREVWVLEFMSRN